LTGDSLQDLDGLLGHINTDVDVPMLPIISKEATSRFQNSGY
jgi:hypothetical protein